MKRGLPAGWGEGSAFRNNIVVTEHACHNNRKGGIYAAPTEDIEAPGFVPARWILINLRS